MLKKAISRTLNLAGYSIARIEKNDRRPIYNRDVFPIELDQDDRAIFDYVRDNDLTMVTNARLYSTLMSSHHVVSNNVPGAFVECGAWRGGNAILAADVFQRRDPSRGIFVFDTFTGHDATERR